MKILCDLLNRAHPVGVAVVGCGYDFAFGDVDGVEASVDFFLPKIEEFVEIGEFGGEVVILPDEFLQDFFVIR